MIIQKDNMIWLKFNGLLRFGFLSLPPVRQGSILVNEYPKSGGSWLTLMLAELIGLPFARNRLPFATARQIFHGHYLNQWPADSIRQVLVWRDGRDILVSKYFHSLFYNDRGNSYGVDYHRARVPFTDYVDIRKNLPHFAKFMSSGEGRPPYGWERFVQVWGDNSNIVHVKYEDLFDDCETQLQRVVMALGYDIDPGRVSEVSLKYSLGKMAPKDRLEEPTDNDSRLSFVRKGGYGGWRKYFSQEMAVAFQAEAGDALVQMGYEKDASWIDTFD